MKHLFCFIESFRGIMVENIFMWALLCKSNDSNELFFISCVTIVRKQMRINVGFCKMAKKKIIFTNLGVKRIYSVSGQGTV